MAYSNFALLNQSSSGAPRNSGTNGDLPALFDWALTSNSNWTSVYNDGGSPVKKRIWAPNGGGIVLMCNHDNTVSGQQYYATMRLAESQSGGTLTDPIPLPSQVADGSCIWQISNGAGTTSRDFRILVCEDGIIYASRYGGGVDQWVLFFAFKCASRYASDPYRWVIGVQNSTGSATSMVTMTGATVPNASGTQNRLYAMRNVLGTIKSEVLTPDYPTASQSGLFNSMPVITAVPDGAFERKKMLLHATGTSTLSTQGPLPSIDRFCVPHLWYVPASTISTIGEADSFTDANGSTYELYRSAGVSGAGLLLQTSNDWTGYPAG
jgi:hypothetical protein